MAGPFDFLRNNGPYGPSSNLLGVGLGLLSGRNAQEQVANAATNFANDRQMGQTYNKTLEYLKQSYPDLASAVESGAIGAGDAWKMAYQQKLEAAKPKNNFITAGKNLYNVDTGQWVSPPAGMGGDDAEYGLNPQYGVDANGNPVIVQLSKSGTSKQTALPDGVKLSKEPIRLDAGTHFVLLDPITRSPIGQIPKNLAEAESQKAQGSAEGKAQAETKSEYDSITSKMPGLYGVVDRLDKLSQDATYTTTGKGIDLVRKELGMSPRDAAVARAEYTAVVDNQILPLLRDTFGAQFTAEEGQRLARTLGDPDKSPTEKQALLRAFIQQKERDIQALSTRLGAAPGSGATPQARPGGTTGSGVRWSVE